ncbi:MAG: hypothetical protein DMF78_13820 [Acidobacteria bacterium]|nr:MAG: hypothetical protein DMF78_13820 [Acidobacteriota bacterium]
MSNDRRLSAAANAGRVRPLPSIVSRSGRARRREVQGRVHELARVPLFERLSPAELEKLETLTSRRKFRSATAVFFQDDPSDSLYVVLSGSAKVFRTSEDGRDRILMIIRPGDAFGELAMIEGLPRSATASACAGSTRTCSTCPSATCPTASCACSPSSSPATARAGRTAGAYGCR